MLEVSHLNFSYGEESILSDISFSLDYGQSVAVLGKNGAGKSTLFKCILQFIQPKSGDVFLNQRSLSELSQKKVAQEIAYIPQKQQSAFDYSVFDMVLMGTVSQFQVHKGPTQAEFDVTNRALEQLGIKYLSEKRYSEISGGEQRLAVIARAMAQGSRVIIMDEPCANLDFGNQYRVLETIDSLANQGYLIIQSTHDPNQALQYTHQSIVLDGGSIVGFGKTREVLTKDLIQQIYNIPVRKVEINGVNTPVILAGIE